MDYAEAYKLKQEGKTYLELEKIFGISHKTLESGVNRYKLRLQAGKIKEPISLLKLLEKEQDINTLMDKTKKSKRVLMAEIEDLKDSGYNIIETNGIYSLAKLVIPAENIHTRKWNGEKVLKFAIMGDPQFNSKYVQITHLHNFYDICAEEGITTVYNTGDIDDGEEMRMGHKYECYNQGADDHIKEIIKNYPKREGITTEFITGNHDHSIIKRCGFDIGNAIADKRPDMKYLGQSNAIINLTPNCTLELRHPIDGTAYAISYKIQKMIESMSGGEKPNILAVGHYHKTSYDFYRNVHAIQTGCFQAQTSWERGKGISVAVGGWIIECHVDQEGTIKRFKPEFIPYYKAIKDDYLNWR